MLLISSVLEGIGFILTVFLGCGVLAFSFFTGTRSMLVTDEHQFTSFLNFR